MTTRGRKKSAANSAVRQQKRMEDKTLCFTGTFINRDRCTQLMTSEGGRVVKGVSARLDYLIVGHTSGSGPSSAEKKAEALNQAGKASIQIIDDYGFKKLFVVDQKTAVAILKSGPTGIEQWNATLSHVYMRLDSADFRDCDLRSADLRFTGLTGCDFRGAKLDGAIITSVRGAKFDKATGAVVINHAEDCSFKNVCFERRVAHDNCMISARNSRFDGASLRNAHVNTLVDCSAKRVDLSGAHINPADFSRTNLTQARLPGVCASYTQASGAVFDSAVLQEAEFDKSDFDGASFRKADLSRARLQSCNFSDADFTGAKFIDADMSHCKLRNANLTRANLRGALLNDADFTGAILKGADLTGANVAGATLTSDQFEGAKGIDTGATQVGKVGPNMTELENVASQSKKVRVTMRVDLKKDQCVELSVESWSGRWASSRQVVHHKGINSTPGPGRSIPDCFLGLANRWARGTPLIDSVEVAATKAPLKKKELRMLAIAAWCEAFGLDIVTEDELKARKKQSDQDAVQLREKAVANLRTGSAGIKKWNKLTRKQRESLGRLRRLDLSGIDLRTAKFGELDLQRTDFSNADLRDAHFGGADLKKANFAAVKAVGTWFSGIKAGDASFKKADLRKSTIRAANLLRTDFSGSRLNNVDFSYSDVRGADFTGAVLKGNTFERVKFDEKTAFPEGFNLPEELIWAGQGKDPRLVQKIAAVQSSGPIDFETFMERLENNLDASRLKKAVKMLKADSFQLFAEVENNSVTGVVKSQTDADLVYSCRLDSEGAFACCTQNLNPCGGLRGALCKHLLVLIVGLTKGEELDPTTVSGWIAASKFQAPQLNKDQMSQVFLKYKGAEAGEIDWRPTETVPEDYYAF